MKCHCGAGGATAVLLRQQGGSMTSCGGYIYGSGFRSFSLPFSLLMRTLLLLLLLLLVYYCYSYLVMPPKRDIIGRTVELGKASKKTFTPIPSVDESPHDEHDDGGDAAETCYNSTDCSIGESQQEVTYSNRKHKLLYDKICPQ